MLNMAKDTATVARRLASQMWGEVQGQLKVDDGIWSFHTAGHGGFVVDTEVHPELKEYNTTVYINAKSNSYYPSEQHFAPFEEDCEYAKVIWLYPYTLKKMMKNYRVAEGVTFSQWQQDRLQGVKRSLEQWNPDFLKEHPKHGSLVK